MNNKIITIMKKEFSRFFGDKRMVFTTMILPGLMIYLVYTFMGQALSSAFSQDGSYKPVIYALNLPPSIRAIAAEEGLDIIPAETENTPAILEAVVSKEADLYLLFPPNFDEAVARYTGDPGEAAPAVELYYNSVETHSNAAYSRFSTLLNDYESRLANKFDFNNGDGPYDLASSRDSSARAVAMMLPLLIMIFMFTGALALATDSIAGEKERNTIAALLITPIKKEELALGKILSISILALLCGLSSITGTMLSMGSLMGGINMNIYGPGEYGLLVLVVFSTIILQVSMISLVSAWGKTAKETQTASLPLMMVNMLAGVIPMFGNGAKGAFYYYLIPLYNSVQSMAGIMVFEYRIINVLLCVITNIGLSALGVFTLSKMLGSEKIMFSR